MVSIAVIGGEGSGRSSLASRLGKKGVQNPGVPINVMLPESLEISLNVLSRPPIPFETFISLIYTTPGIVIVAS